MTEPKPSAWLYDCEGELWASMAPENPDYFEDAEWTETPLFTRDAIEAEIVAWLREMKRADTNWPQVIAGKIERGEYRSKSDD